MGAEAPQHARLAKNDPDRRSGGAQNGRWGLLAGPPDFWLARVSIALIAGLQYLLINNFSFGPRWFAPLVELLILVPLSVASAWTHALSQAATEDSHRRRVQAHRSWIRRSAILLIAFVTFMNFIALADLVRDLLAGAAMTGGQTLLVDALNVWMTNMIVFALWFWIVDRGGPSLRGLAGEDACDFLFPQVANARIRADSWEPDFVDYLYLSFTNSTAFSPTDAVPLSARAKLLMMLEAIVSLLTIALVAARAVNILA